MININLGEIRKGEDLVRAKLKNEIEDLQEKIDTLSPDNLEFVDHHHELMVSPQKSPVASPSRHPLTRRPTLRKPTLETCFGPSSTYVPYYDTLFKQKKVKENDSSFELLDHPGAESTKPVKPRQEVLEPEEEQKEEEKTEDDEKEKEKKVVQCEADSIPMTSLQEMELEHRRNVSSNEDIMAYKSSVMSDQQIKISKFT